MYNPDIPILHGRTNNEPLKEAISKITIIQNYWNYKKNSTDTKLLDGVMQL